MSMKKQKENINNLLELIQENPELPIMPMVETEVVGGDEYNSWLGEWGKVCIDEWWSDDEAIYFRSEAEDRLIDDAMDSDEWEGMTDEEIEKAATEKVAKYDWEKCILVRITTL